MTYWLDLLAFQEQPCHFPLTVWASAAIQTCADRRVSVMYGGGSAVEVGAACCAAQSRKGFIKSAAFAAWLQFWSVLTNLSVSISLPLPSIISSLEQQWSDEKQVLLFYTYAQGLTWWFVRGGEGVWPVAMATTQFSQLHPPTWCSPCACVASFPPTHSRTVFRLVSEQDLRDSCSLELEWLFWLVRSTAASVSGDIRAIRAGL